MLVVYMNGLHFILSVRFMRYLCPILVFYSIGWEGSRFRFPYQSYQEIVKDIEDFEGDVAYGRNTLPIVLGVKSSKVVVSALAAVTIVLLYLVWFSFVRDWVTLVYLSLSCGAFSLSLFLYIRAMRKDISVLPEDL